MKQDASVAIIGAGPIGLELAVALKQAKVSYLHFDKGQIAQMIFNFPTATVFFSSAEKIGIAGIPIQSTDQQKVSREAYLAYLRSVAMSFGLRCHTHEEVVDVHCVDDHFVLTTSSSHGARTYTVRYLVLATGSTSTPRLLGVPGEFLPHVSTKLEDPHLYFQKKVLIVGRRNSAAEAALRCYHAGAFPTVVMRGDAFDADSVKYWILPELQSLISKGAIGCYPHCDIEEILAGSVTVRERATGDLRTLAADFVVKAIGFNADLSLCERLGVRMSEEGQPLFDEQTMETSVPGLFVAGTIVGGTQKRYKIFIENTHVHVERLVKTLAHHMGFKVASDWFARSTTTPLEE